MEQDENDKPHLTEQDRQVLIHSAILKQDRDRQRNKHKPRPGSSFDGRAQGIDFDLF